MQDNPLQLLRVGQDRKKALKINESIYQSIGFGNTFLVVTPEQQSIVSPFRSQ